MPSRRALLRAGGLALAGGLAGCAGGGTPTDDSGTDTDGQRTGTNDRRTDAGTGRTATDRSTPDGLELTVGVRNRDDTDHEVTVELREGETVHARNTRSVNNGVTGLALDASVSPGTYTAAVDVTGGGRATYEWTVGEEYDGSLRAVVEAPDTIQFEEYREETPCAGAGDLPYAAAGQPETFTPGSAVVENDAGRAVTVRLRVAHEGTTFFDCSYDLGASQSVSPGAITATAGAYDVTVDVADGGRMTRTWHVRERDTYPSLVAAVREDGPVVGCGSAESTTVEVRNERDAAAQTTLALARDGETVTERTVDLDAGAVRSVELSMPIGDIYILTAETGGDSDSAEVVECYCFSASETTVTVTGDGPTIESSYLVCQ